jgi:tetrapyrrole methylase family protein / MazG family protein
VTAHPAAAARADRPNLTVVGLGPAGPELINTATRVALDRADAVFLRTSRHPAVVGLGETTSFDHHYDTAATFDEVYHRIVEDLVAAATAMAPSAGAGGVVYAVPGSPLVAERTVDLLRADPRLAVTVVPALSFLDLAWIGLGIDPLAAGVRLVDGSRFAVEAAGERGPLLVAQCWSTQILSEIKLSVDTDLLGELPSATVLHHLGLPDEQVETVRWDELDRAVAPDHLTSVWIPRLTVGVAGELVALDDLVRTLRRECPWDREQTHASLTRHLLEEAYEVIDAVDELTRAEEGADRREISGSPAGDAVEHLEEELGDLLFQVYFHACLAAEEGRFTLADVARGVHDKLVARHPHVFADVVADDPATVVANWEEIKKAEKGRQSVTDGIPAALPALALAAKLARKAGSVPGMALPGFEEERAQAMAELGRLPPPGPGDEASSDGAAATDGETSRQIGALLWSLADLGRRLGVDPEDALRAAALRFRRQVREVEARS